MAYSASAAARIDATRERDAIQSALFRALMADVKEFVYFKDLESRLITVSGSLEAEWKATGIDEYVGLTDKELLPSIAEQTLCDEQEIIRTELPKYDKIERALVGRESVLWSVTSKYPLRADDGTVVGTFGITRVRSRRDWQTGTRTRHERAEAPLTQRPIPERAENLEPPFHAMCQRAIDITGAVGTAVIVPASDATQDLELLAGVGTFEGMVGTPVSIASVSGRAFLTQVPVLCNDAGAWDGEPLSADVGSAVAVPLIRSQRVVGVFTAVSKAKYAFEDADVEALELLALMLAAAMSDASESEARHAEAAALARFQAIFDGGAIGIVRVDAAGKLVDANSAVREMMGQEQLIGRSFSDLLHSSDQSLEAAMRDAVRGNGHASASNEFRCVRGDGAVVWARFTTVRDPGSVDAEATITMLEDVSEQRRAEDQLRQAQKIDAIGQLTAGIAHDFNNLMLVVLGYAEMAQQRIGQDDATRYLQPISDAAQRAADLTRQLLAFGRRQTLTPRVFDVNQLLSESVAMFPRVLGERIRISSDLGDVPPVRADATQVQQVLLNLALNARDAMSDGGDLRFSTAAKDIAEASGDIQPGRYVAIVVTDSGCGIQPDVIDRIFEPFFTTKSFAERHGLGLSSAHGIVKQSGGEISVKSEPGHGSTFTILLPAEPDPFEPTSVAAIGL